MLRATPFVMGKGQFKTRIKKRMVGFVPKVVARKVKGALFGLRSEASTGHMEGAMRTQIERTDGAGKKVERVLFDPVIARFAVFREMKLKGPFYTKSNIAKKHDAPWEMK